MDGVVYMTFYVNIYKCGRAYGGPEEGGWFYSYGEYQWTVAKCENEDVRCMVENHKGQDYPEETPHYE